MEWDRKKKCAPNGSDINIQTNMFCLQSNRWNNKMREMGKTKTEKSPFIVLRAMLVYTRFDNNYSINEYKSLLWAISIVIMLR